MSRFPKLPAWILRIVWVVQPLALVPLLDDASAHVSTFGRVVIAAGAWTAWAVGLLCTLVPSTVSLTVGRLIAPITPVVALTSALAADVVGWKVAVGLGASLLAVVVWFSGETGAMLAQGSAYGAEQRFPLKPPVPFLVPMVVTWIVLCASALSGVVLLANRRWIVGGALAVLAVAITSFVAARFHLLSRRWLVVVPAGVVVHDPMILIENALFRGPALAAIRLAPAGTEAADLTGGTAGVAIEIVLRETDTVVKVGARDQPTGVALHVLSVLVSPSRPGKALAAAAARHLPVG